MKWFKHFSDSLDDPFIQELLDEFKEAGYLAWFGLIEIIAKENGHIITGKIEVKPSYLKRKLRISVPKLERIYDFCASYVEENSDKTPTKPKLLFNKDGKKWQFDLPKLLEIKDNYTHSLEVTTKQPSNHKEVEEEVEVKEEVEEEINSGEKKPPSNTTLKEPKHKYGEFNNVLLKDKELEKLKKEFPTNWEWHIKNMDENIEMKGYKYKSHYLAIKKWSKDKKGTGHKNGKQQTNKKGKAPTDYGEGGFS